MLAVLGLQPQHSDLCLHHHVSFLSVFLCLPSSYKDSSYQIKGLSYSRMTSSELSPLQLSCVEIHLQRAQLHTSVLRFREGHELKDTPIQAETGTNTFKFFFLNFFKIIKENTYTDSHTCIVCKYAGKETELRWTSPKPPCMFCHSPNSLPFPRCYHCILTFRATTSSYFFRFSPNCTSLGEGSGTPLQYSCLENPMDEGAWQAAVHGVAKSRTGLNDFPFPFHFHAVEKEMATHSSVLAWRIPGMGETGGLPLWGRTESDTTEATQQQQQPQYIPRHQRFVLCHLKKHTPSGLFKSTGCPISLLLLFLPGRKVWVAWRWFPSHGLDSVNCRQPVLSSRAPCALHFLQVGGRSDQTETVGAVVSSGRHTWLVGPLFLIFRAQTR